MDQMMINDDLRKPEHLPPLGEVAYRTIADFLKSHNRLHTGGCRAFYSPQEWLARREAHPGPHAVLIVVHDGGDLAPIFNWAYEDYALLNEMRSTLERQGFYCEAVTCWYSIV